MEYSLSKVVLIAVLVTIAYQQENEETNKKEISDQTKQWKKCMDEEKFHKCFRNIFDNETVILANGHKPTKGREETAKWYQEIEEWGPGLNITIDGMKIAESGDLGAMYGSGLYLHLAKMSYIVVWKKTNQTGYRVHFVTFDMWPIEDESDEGESQNSSEEEESQNSSEEEESQDSSETEESETPEGESSEVLKKWSEYIKEGKLMSLKNLYASDCIVLDNDKLPLVGRENVTKTYGKFRKLYKKYGLEKMNITSEGFEKSAADDFAIAYGIWNFGDQIMGTFGLVLVKPEDKWQIQYQSIAHETAV